jgi:hypothetical protein
MGYRTREWVSTQGLPPWRPEAQRARREGGPGASGYWIDVYSHEPGEVEHRLQRDAEREAAVAELRRCHEVDQVVTLIRERGLVLREVDADWRAAFRLLAEGGRLIPPTHQLHRMRLAFPHRIFGWKKMTVDSAPCGQAWQIRAGEFAAVSGHVWCTNFGSGEAGKRMEERLLRGEVPSPDFEPWVGTRTSNPTASVVVPSGAVPTLVWDASVSDTSRRLDPGALVRDYSSGRIAEILKLMA